MPSPHDRSSEGYLVDSAGASFARVPTTGSYRISVGVSLLAAVASAAIAWNSAKHLDILWDEQVDLEIASALAAHPLTGGEITLDASQTRLPMYLCAATFRLTGRTDLNVARWISVLLGAITIVATAALARICFGPLVACLASILLALSPYFLAYERIAMTEGDIALACFMTLSLWAYLRYLQSPTARRWLLAAILFGLAAGAKPFAAVLLVVYLILGHRGSFAEASSHIHRSARLRRVNVLLGIGLLVGAATTAIAVRSRNLAVIGWAVLFALWLCVVVLVFRHRLVSSRPGARFLALVALALITFFALMPVHLTDHQIIRTLARRLLRWDDFLPLDGWRDHLRLYSGILVTKLTLPWGILTCLALVYAAVRERADPRWRSLVYCIVAYVLAIFLLPLRQTFYLMGVYPILVVMTAAFTVEIGTLLKRLAPKSSPAWTVFVFCLLGNLGFQVGRSYPYFHLFNYAWVGNRWLGAESRGYRNLIQTPSDGVAELIRWCSTDPRVHRGDRVVSYLWEDRIIDGLMPQNPHFQLIRRGIPPDTFGVPPPPAIEQADYVLLHINNLLGYVGQRPDWPPVETLSSRFEVVHTVRRGPLAIAWVYARRD